jgi:hypothetical protein
MMKRITVTVYSGIMRWERTVCEDCSLVTCRHDYFLFAQDRWENRRNVNHIVLQIAFG